MFSKQLHVQIGWFWLPLILLFLGHCSRIERKTTQQKSTNCSGKNYASFKVPNWSYFRSLICWTRKLLESHQKQEEKKRKKRNNNKPGFISQILGKRSQSSRLSSLDTVDFNLCISSISNRNPSNVAVAWKQKKEKKTHRSNRFYQGNVSRRDTVETGRHSCRFAAEYASESITPADVRCLPLLTSLPAANPAYPPYWPLLPGLIHRTRPVIPRCADVTLFTPTFTARGK